MIAAAPTDQECFEHLRGQPGLATVNFWTPTDWKIRKLSPCDVWYFILKGKEPRKVGGYGDRDRSLPSIIG